MILVKKQGPFEVFSRGVEEPWQVLRDGAPFRQVWTWREVEAILSGKTSKNKPPRLHSTRTAAKFTLGRGMITEEQARTLPRFDFIAHWLAVVTRKKENRGPLGLHVKHVGTRWQVVSPVGGGTVTYETTDPALLFDYARRGQLGPHIRDAEEFRGLAFERAAR